MSEEIITIYPENIDQVSVINEGVKVPATRISLAEESMDDFFNNPKFSYGDEKGTLSYIITGLRQSEDDDDSIIITAVDMDYPDRIFDMEVPVQYLNSSFLLSQLVKAPMFFVVPSDDLVASLGFGPFFKEEVKVTIEAPARKTPEFQKITKLLFNLSKPSERQNKTVLISGVQVDAARSELIDIILGLIKGKSESVIQAYSHMEKLDRTNFIDETNQNSLTESEKMGIVMKDMLLKLEEQTHPVYLSTLFHTGTEGMKFVQDIEEFESILNAADLDDSFVKELEQEIKITSETSEQDLIAFFSAPIDDTHLPENIKKVISNVKIDYLWEFNWNTALDEHVEFKNLKAGEFFVSMIFVIATRLARLDEVYRAKQHSLYAPLALMITSLTEQGETFMWVVKETVRLLSKEKMTPLFELLTIPNDTEGRSIWSGPAGLLMHGIAHAAIDSGLPLKSIEMALDKEPEIVSFLEKVFEIKDSLPAELSNADESACFIKGLIIPNLEPELQIDAEYASEIIRSLMILGEMSAIKNTEYSLNSPQWQEYLDGFYDKLV